MTKIHWIAIVALGLLPLGASSQTNAGGSAQGNATVRTGQAGASASTSANADASVEKQSKEEKGGKQTTGSKASAGGSGAASANAAGITSGLSGGAAMQAELTKSVDAKNAKAGDPVEAKLTQDVKSEGKVVLHKGSKLKGHVTEAQAHTKEHAESTLGVVFDKAVLKGGEEMQLNATIQALAPAANAMSSAALDQSSELGMGSGGGGGARRSSGGGLLGGAGGAVNSTLGTTTGAVSNTTGSLTGTAAGTVGGTVNNGALGAGGLLSTSSKGVFGMQGLSLSSATAGSAQGSVITSATRNVKLDSGTQMVLQAGGSASGAIAH